MKKDILIRFYKWWKDDTLQTHTVREINQLCKGCLRTPQQKYKYVSSIDSLRRQGFLKVIVWKKERYYRLTNKAKMLFKK